uniref:gamma-soluble NSF attachment protein-like n=1 Tax=Styela clava TaxID=7725 RepID=UPI00193A4E88|nr:gamma-soluble NSF attachment protein-like [Styela clava]
MTDRAAKKLQEGLQHMEEAEKHLKTGFFKWRPDYDSAAASFQNAGLAFKLAKQYEKAYAAYERLADAHYKLGARFHAAKAYEEAGNACRELNDYNKALAYYDRASDIYMENGTPDTAVLCLERAGKMTEMVNAEWSISLYMKAAEICQNEDDSRFRQAAELVGKASRLQLQNNKLSDAINTIGHECQLYSQSDGGGESIPRLTCGLVLVHLHIGDPVSAEQAIHSACDYADIFDGSEEQDALMRLVEAFNEEDQEKVDLVINTPMFKFMDNVYAKLARSLRVPGYSSSKQPRQSAPGIIKATNNDPSTQEARVTNQEAAVKDISNKMNALMNSAPNIGGTGQNMEAPTTQHKFIGDEDDDDLC